MATVLAAEQSPKQMVMTGEFLDLLARLDVLHALKKLRRDDGSVRPLEDFACLSDANDPAVKRVTEHQLYTALVEWFAVVRA